MADSGDITALLPPSLNLPPHLSAHKYFFVCTLTVAAWDTLVLSPRTWRLFKTKEWPALKWMFHFLRLWMPIEFIIVAVAFFDTKWTQDMCQKFYLFEPIATAILISVCSAVHVIRINAIYDKNRGVLGLMGALFAVQVVVMAVCCGFYRSVPLDVGQGCIAGPKANWVGIYWLAPTLLFTISFALALKRSLDSLATKSLGYWKLMLRDGLNLYGAIWIVNMANMLFWFVITPTGPEDTIKTIVTSMAAVLTTTMTLRIILSVRGSLAQGGAFAGSYSAGASSGSRGTTHVVSRPSNQPNVLQIGTNTNRSMGQNPTFSLNEVNGVKSERDYDTSDHSLHEGKEGLRSLDAPNTADNDGLGVKITIDREIDYAQYGRK